MRSWLAVLFLAASFAAGAEAGEVPFGAAFNIYTPAATLPSYVASADVDGDGDLDLLGTDTVADEVSWIENTNGDASSWTHHPVTTSANAASSVTAGDLDGDGDLDLASASFSDDKIAWYENDGSPGGLGDWTARSITTTANGATSVYIADIDGDGDLDVLSASQFDDTVAWYENQGGTPPSFSAEQVITEDPDASGSGAEGFANGAYRIHVADLDGDGDLDVLSASTMDDKIAWYENDGTPGGLGDWTARAISTTADIARAVTAADIDGDGDLDVLSASFDDDKVAWYENQGGTPLVFATHVITQDPDGPGTGVQGEVDKPTSVFVGDVDGDGDIDVVSGGSGDAPSSRVTWYENDGTPGGLGDWTVRGISTAASSQLVIAVDLDGDGDLDPVAATSGDWRWFENQTLHRSARFPDAADANPIGNPPAPQSVATADLDRDGDLDVVSASRDDDTLAWYANDGSGNFTLAEVVDDTVLDSWFIVVADMNGDGAPDILDVAYQSTGGVRWYANDGAGNFGTLNAVDLSLAYPQGLAVGDLDSDGDLDVAAGKCVFAGEGGVWWYENTGAGSFAAGVELVRENVCTRSIEIADPDHDGDLDILVARGANTSWFEGDGGGNFQPEVVFAAPYPSEPRALRAVDLDRDGALDLLSATFDGKVYWNPGDGTGSFPTRLEIASSNAPTLSVTLDDLDDDGDQDILSAGDDLVWYENLGAGVLGTQQLIGTAAGAAWVAATGDLDGDGLTDVVAARPADGLAWHRNRGGQFALPTRDVAYLGMLDAQQRQVLEVEGVHRGRSGDSDAEIVSVAFRLDDNLGAPLNDTQAGNLLSALDLHLDNGNGVFEDDPTDPRIVNLVSFSLVAGVETINFTDGDPDVQLVQGAPNKYFLVATLQGSASGATPNAFEITHLTESSGSGEDRVYDLPLVPEFQADTRTGVIQALAAGSDFDLDGIANEVEVNVHGTDPGNADTDGDALDDGEEVNLYPTDPLDADSDDDGLDDGIEISFSFDPNDPDTDNDGYCDGGLDPGGGACPAGVSDNCPAVSNVSQTNSDAFAPGDDCQCGNVDGVGGLDAADLLRAREALVGRTLGGVFNVAHCDVNDDAACDVADLYVLSRVLDGAGATLDDHCDAYTGP